MTIVVIAGYLTMVVARVKAQTPNPVNVAIPEELWLAMGISSTSLLGTPLLLAGKRLRQPDPKALENTASQLAEPKKDVDTQRVGVLYANKRMQDARIADIFQGDEVGNTAHVDLAKVQMFYFTSIAAVSYFVAVSTAVMRGDTASLPELSQGMVALLAIRPWRLPGEQGDGPLQLEAVLSRPTEGAWLSASSHAPCAHERGACRRTASVQAPPALASRHEQASPVARPAPGRPRNSCEACHSSPVPMMP